MSRVEIRNGLVAALDVGTTKVACLIARVERNAEARIVGFGYNLSRGLKNGVITDMVEAKDVVAHAVEAAEQMANERIENVLVNVSGSRLRSTSLTLETSLGNKAIGDSEVKKLLDRALYRFDAGDQELIHCIPTGYIIDGENDIQDPRGMFGETLGLNLHLVTSAPGPVRNLQTVIESCHLDIMSRIVSPYASGLSCLVDDEKELGATIIDMGGGTTSLAVFKNGHVIHTASIAVGGSHVTQDIALGLTTSVAQAERLKTVEGCAFSSPKDNREMIKVYPVGETGENASRMIPRSELNEIIIPRIEETLELVQKHLKDNHLYDLPSHRVVLTGGASQLQGLREKASYILNRQVRIGTPVLIRGLPTRADKPDFATCIGMIRYATQAHVKKHDKSLPELNSSASKLERLGQWLFQNF